jgi:hypothetical protein
LPANRSLGVWCKPKNSQANAEIEAHFNYWRIAGDKAFKPSDGTTAVDFIEVGVLIDDASQIELIRIFAPIYVDPQLVADCSEQFEDVEIAQGIFNEVLKVTGPAITGPRCVELLRADGSIFARVHSFALTDGMIGPAELSVVHQDGGSLLTIEPAALADAAAVAKPGEPTYFRIRIYVAPQTENPIVRVLPTPDKLLQSSYDEIEYLDFRVNEARTLPDAVEQQMRADQGAGIVRTRLIAFLAAVPVKSQLSVSNSPSHKMRLLEHDLWNGYVPGGIPHGMVVYHWKREAGRTRQSTSTSPESGAPDVRDFTAFVKLQTKQASNGIWIAYLIVAFLIGIAGNLTSELFTSLLSHSTEGVSSPQQHPPKGHPTSLPPPPANVPPSVSDLSNVENGS